ncbi:MAG: DUF1924 domain-containing protein [Deltaproteobacteria bacterium]|nr:DUF1924 domain-containing protein [Deltaproteobacteria bacterium]
MREKPSLYLLSVNSAKNLLLLVFSAVLFSGGIAFAAAPETQAILNAFMAESRKAEPNLKTFSAEEGKMFFNSKRTHTAKKEERSCTTCHTDNPARQGKTPVGKIIEPMAASVNKERFMDNKKVEKWFKRNCVWVLERECTAKEKGNYITFMLSR